jgi:hypothetical protein
VDAASSRLYLEFNALACHRPPVREFIARSNSRDRITMTSALRSVFQQYGIDPERFPAEVVATAMAGMARVFATDRALGTKEGHAQSLEFVDRLLGDFEPLERQQSPALAEQRRLRAGKTHSPPSAARNQKAPAGDQDAID